MDKSRQAGFFGVSARTRHPGLRFSIHDVEDLSLNGEFDYIVMRDRPRDNTGERYANLLLEKGAGKLP